MKPERAAAAQNRDLPIPAAARARNYLRIVADAPPNVCPKCSTTYDHRRDACARCGLATVRMAGFLAGRGDTAAHPEVRDAWHRALAAWQDPKCHDEVLLRARQHASYTWVAARYRETATARGTDLIAVQRLALVKRAAELTLLVSSAHPEDAVPGPYRATRMLLALLVVMLAVGTVLGHRALSRAQPAQHESSEPGYPDDHRASADHDRP